MNTTVVSQAIENNKLPADPYKDSLVKSSFYFTYVFLITTGTITFIEALRTKNPVIRHIMNIETCISIVAAFFYSQFTEKLKETEGKEIPYESINLTRYTDWLITTPLMLLVLCMVLGLENNKAVKFTTYAFIIMLNFGMLASGYMGETKKMDKRLALIIGFVFFFVMFWIIWSTFMGDSSSFAANASYLIFFVFWSIYGAIYLADDKTKNIVFNVLDLIAKAFVGIFFWLYFTKAVVF